jgi:hypothetical protein
MAERAGNGNPFETFASVSRNDPAVAHQMARNRMTPDRLLSLAPPPTLPTPFGGRYVAGDVASHTLRLLPLGMRSRSRKNRLGARCVR